MHHPTPGELASAADGPTFLWTVIGAGAIPAFLLLGCTPLVGSPLAWVAVRSSPSPSTGAGILSLTKARRSSSSVRRFC